MFEKYNDFAYSLSAPEQCSHCGAPTAHHNYYPHFAATAVISSVATMLAFAVPLLIWAQTADFGNQPLLQPLMNNQTNQMNPGNFQGQPNNSNGPINQPNQPGPNAWADWCKNNTAVTCVDSSGKTTGPGLSSDGQPSCPEGMSWKCLPASQQQNNQQGQQQNNSNMPNRQSGTTNQPGPTCQINGQDQPGPCSQANFGQPNPASPNVSQGGQNFNPGQNEQDQQARDAQQQAQRLKDMKRGALDMQRGLKTFKTQIAKITKQGLPIPPEITANLAKAQELIDKINSAKTGADLEDFDMSEVGDVMQTLNESRGQLQVLSQLPSILKQMKTEIKRQTNDLARANKLATNLSKKGLDVSQHLASFTNNLAQLKSVYDELNQKIQSGSLDEDLMSTVGQDFFEQIQEAYQPYKTIQIISNLGTFKSNFKLQLNQAASQIKQVERKKLEAAELKSLYNQAKEKGDEIIAGIKDPNLDPESIISSLDELQQIQQDFRDQFDELTGNSSLPVPSNPQPQMPQLNTNAWGQTGLMNNPQLDQVSP
ncbi:MAG: hypothetical protein NTV81_02350 [Candidatus Komeilibacteria bacterium]|nr:hypothetical protein [Candidatus Komeilibacteria bacterium]